MRDDKIRLMLRFTVALSYVFLVICILTAPRFGSAQPDPYFQLKNMPPTYWIGVLTSIAALLMSVFFWRQDTHQIVCLGLLALLSLTIYTNIVPRLMYENPIWMDTYTFVGETFGILKYGHMGWGESVDVPGISLLSSQLSLITGLDYTLIASYIPSLFSLIMVLLVYSVAQLFVSKRGAILAGFFYISFYYIGFYFNRRCFSLPLQMLVWYYLAGLVLGRRERSWYVAMVLSYAALVISHPATSFFVMLNTFAPIILYSIIRLMTTLKAAGKYHAPNLRVSYKVLSAPISLMFLVMWFFWYVYHPGKTRSFQAVIAQTMIAMNSFLNLPSPEGGVVANISGYTPGYYPIVMLRFFEILFVTVIGVVLALLYVFSTKFNWKAMVLSSWFLSDISLFTYVTYAYRTSWSDMPFRYSLPASAVLIAWFVIHFRPSKPVMRTLVKTTRVASLGIMLFCVLVLPLTMYAHMAFVYPPTANLKFNDYLTTYGRGSIAVIGGHMELEYFRFVNEGYNYHMTLSGIYGTGFSVDTLTSYDMVATNFRAYAKTAFVEYDPPLTQKLVELEEGLTRLHFARVYDSPLHEAYVRVRNGTLN